MHFFSSMVKNIKWSSMVIVLRRVQENEFDLANTIYFPG